MAWQASRSRDATGRSLVFVVILILLVSVLFTLAPELDLAFSRLFFDGVRFPLARNGYLRQLRSLTDWFAWAILGASVLLLCSPPLRTRSGVRVRDLLLPFAAYGLGVGFIVNTVFKQYFGRARPRDVLEFGGDQTFTAAWRISEACQANCSFTSGEAAGAMAIYSSLALLPALSPRLRLVTAAVIGCLSTALGLNRIAFGAHFLSDVLLSMLIVLAILLATKIVLDGKLGAAVDRLARNVTLPGLLDEMADRAMRD
ncbi:phosphatase PAP2 family protein [Pseudomonas sp. R2.Fl]|nr:phosphatase PAP2 family protein [Pseudomonas sp. R2.Fl]